MITILVILDKIQLINVTGVLNRFTLLGNYIDKTQFNYVLCYQKEGDADISVDCVPDVVICTHPGLLQLCRYICTKYAAKLVIAHELGESVATIELLANYAVCDLVLYPSKFCLDIVSKQVSHKGTVLYNGIALPEPRMLRTEFNNKLLGLIIVTNTAVMTKNLFATVSVQNNVHWQVHGKLLPDQISRLPDNCSYYENTSYSDIFTYIKDVDFVIVPSLMESFGLIALETIASGTLLLSSMRGGMQEFLTEDVCINCGVTTSSISNAINKIQLLTKDNLTDYYNNGLALAKQFNIENIIKIFENIIKELIYGIC